MDDAARRLRLNPQSSAVRLDQAAAYAQTHAQTVVLGAVQDLKKFRCRIFEPPTT